MPAISILDHWIKTLTDIERNAPTIFSSLREELQLTQSELAGRLGVTNVHISRIESGKASPSFALMKRLHELRQRVF